MILLETRLESAISTSNLGRYEIVRLVLKWISANRQNESYRKLTQIELINKALDDVVTGNVTLKKINELQRKNEKRSKYGVEIQDSKTVV